MSHRPPVSSELSRDLNLFHVTMMGLGMMIGAGVFLGTGKTIHESGPGGVIMTFGFNGLIALFTAMSYAELSSAIPRAGGAYNFARIGFGRSTSFVAGWMEWFASSVAGSLYAICFATYTVSFVAAIGQEWIPADITTNPFVLKGVAVAVAMFFIYINYRGASETGKIGAIMTLLQTAFLVVIGLAGIWVAIRDPSRLENFNDFMPKGYKSLMVTMGFTAVAFEGYEVIAQAGDETKNPRENIPKAMLYSVLIVTLTYVAVAFATMVSVPADAAYLVTAEGTLQPWEWIGSYGEMGFREAMLKLIPRGGNIWVTLAVIFASTSALNATIFSATRASYALGRDRMLPAAFEAISERRKTPYIALLATGLIVIVVATLLPTQDVVGSASIMFLFLFLLVNVCVIRIRLNMGDELEYGYVMPLFPLFPVLAIICQAVLAVHLVEMSVMAWVIAPIWIGIGVVIYYAYSKSRALPTEDEIQILEDDGVDADRDGYRIMVPVANPDNALDLVRTTYKLSSAYDCNIDLLHMVEVPDQVPLSDADKYMMEGKEGIVEAMLYLSPMFPVFTTIRYCRTVARGIISAVREKRINLLIMGWHGKRSGRFNLGSTLDPIIERSPSSVVILKNCGSQSFNRVLVPVSGGPNAAYALEIASVLVEKEVGKITVLSVERGSHSIDLTAFIKNAGDTLRCPVEMLESKTVEGPDVVEAILAESEHFDLVVLGCTREPLMSQVTQASIPDKIADRCEKAVVMVKAAGGVRSWIKRWF